MVGRNHKAILLLEISKGGVDGLIKTLSEEQKIGRCQRSSSASTSIELGVQRVLDEKNSI